MAGEGEVDGMQRVAEQLASALGAAGESVGRFARHMTNPREDGARKAEAVGPVERAESVVNQAERRFTGYAATAWIGFRRIFARAREEAEDIWAEAQARRSAG